VTERGGPQLIPRPPGAKQGDPAPWSFLPPEQRVVTAQTLRDVFTGRVGASSIVEAEGTVHPSAVLAPFYEIDGELHVVLTRRSWDLRSHTGEVSFPGGRVEDGESVRDAALREAHEEIRLDPTTVDILGELDHLMTVTSRSFIVPYVALLPDVPDLHPNPSEVDAVLHVPVHELLRDDVYREEHWIFQTPPPWVPPDAVVPDGPVERAIFFFELVGDTVWGATAAMLRHLLGLALDLGVGIDHV
jgi:8-oxo-dGTP pyrophosphatase MutT (NUDIX family)